MKKICTLVLVFMFLALVFVFRPQKPVYKIIKVKSANEFYIDFNQNSAADDDELVEMYYVRAFCKNLPTQYTSLKESAILSFLADEYAKSLLLNQNVSLVYDSQKRLKTVKINTRDYSKELCESGLGIANASVENNEYKTNPDKIKNKLSSVKNLNLVSFNPNSNKFHRLWCKFAFKSNDYELLPYDRLNLKIAKQCKLCSVTKPKKHLPKKYPRIEFEKYSPVYTDSALELYLSDFTKYFYPSNKCVVTACQSLKREIENAKLSIDFALYGISNQPEIIDSLKNAANRGVKIRWVYDLDSKGNSIYKDTLPLTKILTSSKPDYSSVKGGSDFSSAIMHNKFFIFDNKKVWIGSANISETDMSGFNANSVLLIDSPQIASAYTSEFENLYSNHFHKNKNISYALKNVKVENSEISVFFSPQDKAIENQIIPLIKSAEKYIYMPVFIITHKNLVKELIIAKNRGVDVRLILDAAGASNKYSPVKELRKAGLKVKTENRAGKMHMKSVLIDDKYTVVGSMNFTNSGENHNDENVLIIKNPQMTVKFKNHFLFLWTQIPDKWLYKNPRAESPDSLNSCFDGVDNDHDGFIDKDDPSCAIYRKRTYK